MNWCAGDRRCKAAAAAAIGLTGIVVGWGAAAMPPAVIPWLNQHPAKASAHPPLAPRCRARDLRAQLFLQGATGSLVGGVDFRNVGKASCALLGWPSVSFTGAATATTKWQVKKLPASPAPLDVLADPPGSLRALKPGKSATLSLFWSNWCGPGAVPTGASGTPPDAIAFRLAGGTSLTVPLTRAPRCDAPEEPSLISVRPFTPTTGRLPESSKLPLHATIVGRRPVRVKPGVRAFRVRRGQLLRYRVALLNTGKKPFRFAPSTCPVYIEELVPDEPQVYLLNCRPVAMIAPRATVLFAMQIRVPARALLGVGSLTWELAPKTYEAPFASAALWVVP